MTTRDSLFFTGYVACNGRAALLVSMLQRGEYVDVEEVQGFTTVGEMKKFSLEHGE